MASIAPSEHWVAAAHPGEFCNLLQVAASALHLLETQLDDELRPLIRAALAAIRQAAASAPGTTA